ncbi:hypothetical protein ACX0HA_08760 [Flavobacterium hauense]
MRNAFYGYSYQKLVTTLILSMMDVERKIDTIEIEAVVDHKFDDIKVTTDEATFFFQIKDFKSVSLSDITISDNQIYIAGKPHKFSEAINVLCFNAIAIDPNCEILGIPAYKFENIYIISQSRLAIESRIEKFYHTDPQRKYLIDQFFSELLDNRILEIKKTDLPALNIFKTYLVEPTIVLARKVLNVENILLIKGKPGVGKSHLVVSLEKQFDNCIIYRFWVSNQNNDYHERLQYSNFIQDFSKKIFHNLRRYTEAEVIEKLAELEKTVIIDGFDHVENYNPKDFDAFVRFIDDLKKHCKVIVLSRPLQRTLSWKKQLLQNWNREETAIVLKDLYRIEKYNLVRKIFAITDGYPILVRYIAEQYKIGKKLPDFKTFGTLDNYYEEVIANEKGKQALSLFLCVRSYLMESEISSFLDGFSAAFVLEFVKEHPYLFELRLNRISLFHDSFITFLRKKSPNYKDVQERVNAIAYASIMGGEKRFLSRFSYFDFYPDQSREIIRRYACLTEFKTLMEGVIDFEAIRDFYNQIREILAELPPEDFTVLQYFDLAMVINIVQRDHISTLNGFNFTYCKSLIHNGFSIEQITSSDYLFGMMYYLQTDDGSLLMNGVSNSHYDTSRFFYQLKEDVDHEMYFFDKHEKALSAAEIEKLIKRTKRWEYRKTFAYILENLYIHAKARGAYKKLYKAIKYSMKGEKWKAESTLEDAFWKLQIEEPHPSWILKDARENLLSLGMSPDTNGYCTMSLAEFIRAHRRDGSFTMWVDILNFTRLALHQQRNIDIESISMFWTKYYQRGDHSLYSLDVALPIFERAGYTNMFDSVVLITKIQEMSEKGHRGLLAAYIMEHEPEFIMEILQDFHPTNLRISWFDLNYEYINILPDRIYDFELRELLRFHRSSNSIDYYEIENLLDSNKVDKFREDLIFNRFKIQIKDGDPEIEKLKALKIPYQAFEEKSYGSYETSGEARLEQGILDMENIAMIKEKQLRPHQVAAYGNGNYAAMADPDVYNVFEKEDIRKNIRTVLHSAITSRLTPIDYFHTLWTFPGNVLKLIDENQVDDHELKEYYDSFMLYLDLSMFELGYKQLE